VPVGRPQLAEQIGEVAFDHAFAYAQFGRDLARGTATGCELQTLPLA
jgi:hypothetical protein